MSRPRRPRPLCACGCGQPVRLHIHTWVAGHVPRAVRQAAGRKGRQAFSNKRRAVKYKAIIDEVLGARRTISKSQIYEIANRVGRREFTAGWNAHRDATAAKPWPKQREGVAA